VTIFSFFAFWCDTWKSQSPRIREAGRILNGLPIDTITISIDGRWSDVPGSDPVLRCLLDRAGWSAVIGVDRVPTTLVVDAEGVVRWSHSGVVRVEDLVTAAKSALEPRKQAQVHLCIKNFPPADGGYEMLDQLRRLGVRATLVSSDLGQELVKRACDQGQSCVQTIRLTGPTDDPYDETRPGPIEIVRRVVGRRTELHGRPSCRRSSNPRRTRDDYRGHPEKGASFRRFASNKQNLTGSPTNQTNRWYPRRRCRSPDSRLL
jgi:hypothetical protein